RAAAVIRLVATREVRERLRARSFLIGTGVLVAAILAAGAVSRFIGGDGPGSVVVGIAEDETDEVVASFAAVGEASDRELELVFVPAAADRDPAEAALAEDDFDVLV